MPAINKPNQHFDVLTWSGTGGSSGATRSITGLNFQPDLIWEKSRTSGSNHQVLDSVRGVGQNKTLATNSTGTEPTPAGTESLYGWLSAINSDGFTLTNGTSTFDNWNKSGDNYVAWTWKAGGTAVTNTSGTISSQVSANPTAGFSVVTYTGNGSAGATFGHGLGVAPSFVIVKERGNVNGWLCYHISTGNTGYLELDATLAFQTLSTVWNNTTPSSSVVTLGTVSNVNRNGGTFVAYCFAAVSGYSAFGSYTGNGSSDGPFVYLGFRPRFVMFKRTDTTASWFMEDSSRGTYNVMGPELYANAADVEATSNRLDFLSNGFKMRAANAGDNASGGTYIYAAFAETPFKFSNGR